MTAMERPEAVDEPAGQDGQRTLVTVEQRESVVVCDVTGDIDMLTAPQLERELMGVLADGPEVLVLDLSQVGFLASAGLAVLVALQERASEHGAGLRVVAAGSVVARPLQLTGLDQTLAVYPTRAEALTAE